MRTPPHYSTEFVDSKGIYYSFLLPQKSLSAPSPKKPSSGPMTADCVERVPKEHSGEVTSFSETLYDALEKKQGF